MASFLVYRHGSNAENQSMTSVKAVAIVDANDKDTAERIAYQKVNCYNNQRLELVEEEDLTAEQVADWGDLLEEDALRRSNGLSGLTY